MSKHQTEYSPKNAVDFLIVIKTIIEGREREEFKPNPIIESPEQHICNIVGENYGKTKASVERAMQNAICRVLLKTEYLILCWKQLAFTRFWCYNILYSKKL